MLKNRKHEKEFDTQTLFTDIGLTAQDTKETTDRRTIAGSVAKAAADQRTQAYEPRPLTPDDDIYEDIIEQFASAPTKPKYWFEEFGDYWSCSCGHINKGDQCKSCGLERELLRSLFILHKPTDAPGKLDKKLKVVPIEEAPGTMQTAASPSHVPGRKKASPLNRKIIIAIAACILLIAGGGAAIYTTMDSPSLQAEAVQTLQTNPNCLDDVSTQTSKLLIQDAATLTGILNDVKFAYVKEHLDEGTAQAEDYMAELMAVKYPGIQEIYDEYYAWHVNIVANTSEDDYSTDLDSVSRNDTVYFHSSLSGGEPDEIIELYYKVTWPNGSSQIYGLDSRWEDGSRITARFQYPIPLFGTEGKLTFSLYNKSTDELMGSDSITFVN